MKWIIILTLLLLASCSQTNNSVDKIPVCDGDNFPCLSSNETLNEFNYCESDEDCVFAEIPDCECKTPDSHGTAVNVVEKENYDSLKNEKCENVSIACPMYSPPSKFYVYEAQCVSSVCQTVIVGVRK